VQKSPSTDEPIHLFAGYSYLKWGDFRSNPENPPLAKLWAALPLLAFDINDSWQFNIHWDLIPQYPPHVFHIDAVAAEMLFRDNDANAEPCQTCDSCSSQRTKEDLISNNP
jgi:hypothetical protein